MRFLLVIIITLFISTFSVSAQQFELFGGINSNHLFDSNDKSGSPYSSELESGKGYTVGFSFDNPNMNGYASRITLSYNLVKGAVNSGFIDPDITDTGSYSNASINKNSINLAVYPFTFIVQKIYFSFGLQANFMLSNTTTGEYGDINIAGPIAIDNISKATEPTFHKDFSYGIAMRVHYEIILNNELSIIPHYNLYYGLGEEYATRESEKIKAWQQVLALGLGIRF